MKCLSFVLVCVIAAASVAPASAAPFTANFTSYIGENVSTNHANGKSTLTGTIAAQLTWTVAKAPINTFCIEITRTLFSGTFDTVPLASAPRPNPGYGVPLGGMGTNRSDALSRLYATAYATLIGGKSVAANNSASLNAAFQLAIWEIVYDYEPVSGVGVGTGLDLTKGDFRASASAGTLAQANAWLAAVTGVSGANSYYSQRLLGWSEVSITHNNQDQIVVGPGPGNGGNEVPEPASFSLLAIGAIGMAGYRARRRKLAAA